ncbi:MAG: MOSC domain-containing protein [Tsuneonella sp.]
MNEARIVGLARSGEHAFSKDLQQRITLIEGIGVEGDAHAGRTVQHLSRMKVDPDQPNLRQVHLIHAELFDEVAVKGFHVAPGQMGENVTTRGIALLDLPAGTVLEIGAAALRITGLRNPCWQIDTLAPGLLAEMVEKRPDGSIVRKAGVMAVVERGGEIAIGMPITVRPPSGPLRSLEPV